MKTRKPTLAERKARRLAKDKYLLGRRIIRCFNCRMHKDGICPPHANVRAILRDREEKLNGLSS